MKDRLQNFIFAWIWQLKYVLIMYIIVEFYNFNFQYLIFLQYYATSN